MRSIMNLLAISQGLSENKNQDFPDDFPTFNLQDLKKCMCMLCIQSVLLVLCLLYLVF